MEPNDLNSPSSDDPQLEAWLRASAALPPLPDNGFTSRVVATLPVTTAQRSTQRMWFCVAGALVGLAVAALKIFTAPDLAISVPTITPDAARAMEQLADPKLLVAVAVTAASLAFAFRPKRRRLVRL